jgi:TRAP-type C4-dicarboxylate transport system substrate-binding protein
MTDEEIRKVLEAAGQTAVEAWWKQQLPRLRKLVDTAQQETRTECGTIIRTRLEELRDKLKSINSTLGRER